MQHTFRISSRAHLIREAHLIVWDEAFVTHRWAFEAVDRSMRDITNDPRPFGGKVVVFSGDGRQTLPIVRHGTRAQTVAASLRHSPLWQHVSVLRLTQNLRVRRYGNADAWSTEYEDWLLRIGNGTERSQFILHWSEYCPHSF